MQYFGYLRRNPNDAPEPGLNFGGYNFWLGKLNEFNGNYIDAEMVKAFIISGEYRAALRPVVVQKAPKAEVRSQRSEVRSQRSEVKLTCRDLV